MDSDLSGGKRYPPSEQPEPEYWTVCGRTIYWANLIQSCSLNQPITFKVLVNQSQIQSDIK